MYQVSDIILPGIYILYTWYRYTYIYYESDCFCSLAVVVAFFGDGKRCEEDARVQATEAGVATGTPLERDPDVLDTWFRCGGPITPPTEQ